MVGKLEKAKELKKMKFKRYKFQVTVKIAAVETKVYMYVCVHEQSENFYAFF